MTAWQFLSQAYRGEERRPPKALLCDRGESGFRVEIGQIDQADVPGAGRRYDVKVAGADGGDKCKVAHPRPAIHVARAARDRASSTAPGRLRS